MNGFVDWFRAAAPYIHAFRGRTFVIALAGEVVADPLFVDLIHDINVLHSLGIRLVLVHGARPQIEAALATRGIPGRYHKGLRITDRPTLDCVLEAQGKVYAEIDGPLLLMFAGLFVVVRGLEHAVLTPDLLAQATRLDLGNTAILTGVTAILSNLVSNVPAVLVLKPFIEHLHDPQRAWLVVAMASTLAGNFTLLGSVANLIVAERAAKDGITIDFWTYFRIGAPLTLATLAIGVLVLS